MTLFPRFVQRKVRTRAATINLRTGGQGPAVLLLHGYPQTHAMWHRQAPALAERHMVIVADLRGYGDSGKPPAGPDHASYSKRAMATDQVRLMRALGFEEFAVAGHDRGARVAHRMCLDHPGSVSRVALLDIVPTRHVFSHVDRELAQTYYHWFFLTQPAGLPEQLIGALPETFLRRKLAQWSGSGTTDCFDPDAVAEYVRCFSDPATIHASCEDYRAAATVDLEHDEVDATAGRRVSCPVLVLWGSRGFVGGHYDVLAVWRAYADDLRGGPVDCGHFLPEEAPEQTLAALAAFLPA